MASSLFGIGKLTGSIARARALGVERNRSALMQTALLIERKYKEHLGDGGAHRYGTPTPASPGSGPAVISGQLRRSATHVTTVMPGVGLAIRIGPANTPRAPYRKGGSHRSTGLRTTSRKTSMNAVVGEALETGLRNGTKYPALLPAFKEGVAASEGLFQVEFRKPWKA